VFFVKYLLFKSVSRKHALNFAGSHPQFFVDHTPAWFSHFMLPLNLYLVTYLPFLFWFSFLFYLSNLRLVCTPTYPSVSLLVTLQPRYRFSDSPNFSGVDFVPHATYFSVQMDIPFLPKLTSRLNIPIHTLQATPWYQTLVVLDLQFYLFALLCFVGKLWWIGPLCSFSSLDTVSIVRSPTCHYWVFRFIPFP
jgi:hypothetical protein